MRRVDVAVFDLDNTLYDWYASFIPAFYSMVDVAANLLSCGLLTLLGASSRRRVNSANPTTPRDFCSTRSLA